MKNGTENAENQNKNAGRQGDRDKSVKRRGETYKKEENKAHRDKKEGGKTLRYIGYMVRDCYHAYPAFIIAEAAISVITVVFSMASPLVLAHILELAAEGAGDRMERLLGSILLYGGMNILGVILATVSGRVTEVAGVYGEKYFGNRLFAFSKRIRLEMLENPEVLDKFKRARTMMEQEGVQFRLLGVLFQLLESVGVCVGSFLVVYRYSPVFVVSELLGVIPFFLIEISVERSMTAFRRRQSTIERRADYLWGLLSGKNSVKEMRVMGFGGYLMKAWQETNLQRVEEMRRQGLSVMKKSSAGVIVENLFFVLNNSIALFYCVTGRMHISGFAACFAAFANFQSNLENIVECLVTRFGYEWHIVEDYYDYFTIPTEDDGTREYRPFRNKIAVKNVHFRYNGSDREALQGLNLEIGKGEHVVIVGENGSGKTTFSKLLTGAYLPCEGSVSYDGQRTEDLNRRSLYDHISVVNQDFVHYQFTLRENIGISNLRRMEDTGAMEALLEKVAGDGLLSRVGGLDVQLGREFGGTELSGGEWQKIAIARGLWKESDIIILDEPTSALDPLVEYDILSQFIEMISDKTSVIISHRVGICRTADKIIVMKDGRVQECGRHEELLRAGGEYARLWEAQAKWYV